MALRPSQVETLRLVEKREQEYLRANAGMEPRRLAAAIERTEKSARARLERLRESGHLYPLFGLAGDGGYYHAAFRLTGLGKEALESSSKGEGR
jgi:hypothetical protein